MQKLIILGISEDNSYVSGKPVFEKVKETIETYRPVFVLAEQMENYRIETERHFMMIMKKKRLSNMTMVSEVKELIKVCRKNKAKLIGIDFENFLMTKEQQLAVKKHLDLSEKEKEELEKLAARRANKHLKMIKKFLGQSRKPVVALIPVRELKKGSLIRENFRNFSEGCTLIYPVDKSGKIAIKPEKGKLEWKEEGI